MQGFGVGDSTMVTIGGELFSDLGIEIRSKTRAKQTWIMGYANDRIGYIPTIEAFNECEKLGYEEMFGLKVHIRRDPADVYDRQTRHPETRRVGGGDGGRDLRISALLMPTPAHILAVG